MGKNLLPATQARNTIEALVKSGAIDGEVATAWKRKLADETKVKETRAKAEDGNGDAMYCLGTWYGHGTNCLAVDKGASSRVVRAQRGGPPHKRVSLFW